jgi:uncharacterized membrane protein
MSDYAVVENPAGPVFVAVTTEYNPYRKSDEPVPLERAVVLDRDAEFVRFCCFVDGILAFLNVVMLLNPIALFPLLASIWGNYGVKTYNYRLLVSFLVYQYLYSLGRWGLLGYALWYNFERETEDDYRYWVLMSVLPLMQTYITWRVQKFYNTLKNIYINTTAYSEV